MRIKDLFQKLHKIIFHDSVYVQMIIDSNKVKKYFELYCLSKLLDSRMSHDYIYLQLKNHKKKMPLQCLYWFMAFFS